MTEQRKTEPGPLTDFPIEFKFTRLEAQVVEEDGAFTVSVRIINHLNRDDSVWGEEIAETLDIASEMIGSLASRFSIPQQAVSIKLVLHRYKDGTLH